MCIMVGSQGQERDALGRAAMKMGATFSRYARYLVKVLTTMTAQVRERNQGTGLEHLDCGGCILF